MQPTYLWALFSLAIPLLIHLLNKGDVKTVKVGSVKFLKESDTKQSRKIRLNELFLLFLRMLLLVLIILYLAEPRWESKIENASITCLIEPSLVSDEAFMSFTDSLPQNNIKWFAEGFPDLESEVGQNEVPKYWQLAQKLNEVPSDSIIVFTKGLVKGIKGRRPQIGQNVHWVIVEKESQDVKPIAARNIGDSIILFEAESSTKITDLKVSVLDKKDGRIVSLASDSLTLQESGNTIKIPMLQNDTLNITLAYDDIYKKEMQYVTSSLKAIERYGMRKINLKIIDADAPFEKENPLDLLIWLKDSKLPIVKQPALAMVPDSLANSLIETTESKNVFYLTERLTIENSIEENLTNTLATLILYNRTLNDNFSEKDQRVVPEAAITPILRNGQTQMKVRTLDISTWILLATVLVILFERVLSKLRKQ